MRPHGFDEDPDLGVLTTSAVLAGAPILLVTRDEDDGGWQFLDRAPRVARRRLDPRAGSAPIADRRPLVAPRARRTARARAARMFVLVMKRVPSTSAVLVVREVLVDERGAGDDGWWVRLAELKRGGGAR